MNNHSYSYFVFFIKKKTMYKHSEGTKVVHFKTSAKVTLIKTVWHRHKKRHAYKLTQIVDPERGCPQAR